MTRLFSRAPVFARASFLSRPRRFTTTVHRYKRSKVPKLDDVKVVNFQAGIESNFQEFSAEDGPKDTDVATDESVEAAKQAPQSNSLIKAFLYGSTPKDTPGHEHSFSHYLTSGQRTHEITFHWVKPAKTNEYIALMQEFHRHFPRSDAEGAASAGGNSSGAPGNTSDDGSAELQSTNLKGGRLLGAWKAVIGSDVDTYVHIWEYPNIASLHNSAHTSSPEYEEFSAKLAETLRRRSCEIVQEFAFWGGTARPRDLGGIFELRKYDLQPGKMLEWEFYWRKGIEYRREVMEPVGAWFTNIGPLNRVYHLWQFTDLQHRKISRDRSWEKSGWAETTRETVKLLNTMESIILLPLDYSPLK